MFSEVIARRGIPPTIYDPAIDAATRGDWQLETLVRATIARESAWDPNAINPEPGSPLGPSRGLMQITLPTAQLFDQTIQADDLLDPWLNVAVGTEYLRGLLARYSLSDAVAAYNAGTPRRRADGRYVNQGYVDDVLTYSVYYQNQLPAVAQPEDQGAAEPGPAAGASLPWLAAGLLVAVLGAAAWGRGRT